MREIAAGTKNKYGLTEKEEGFAQDVAKGLTLTEAFKNNYSYENYTPESLWAKASGINAREKVKARVEQLQRQNENTAVWSRRDALERLLTVANDAQSNIKEPVIDKDGNLVGYKYNAGAGNVIVKAVEAASKMCGYNEPETTENKVEIIIGGSADEYAE